MDTPSPASGDNPRLWSSRKKLRHFVIVCFFSGWTSIATTGYLPMQAVVTAEFSVSPTTFLVGNLLFFSVGVAFTPLLVSPLSEILGRRRIYLVSTLGFALLCIPPAAVPAPTFWPTLLARLLQGCFASVGNSTTAGTVSDLYGAESRGLPMSILCLAIYVGQGVGPPLSSAILAAGISWRWIYALWALVVFGLFVVLALFFCETRPAVSGRDAEPDSELGNKEGAATREKVRFGQAVRISLSRSAWWLVSEPIVSCFALWVGFLWGCIFLIIESVPTVFEAYGWSEVQKSSVLLAISVGGVFGWLINLHQDTLYARAAKRAAPDEPGPEARLYWACVAAVVAPMGFFIYAWTGRASITPVAPIVGLTMFSTATFILYVASWSYLADAYSIYAASALAAQSWLRNFLAGIFTLVAPRMYEDLSPPIASTMLACIALGLAVCPFVFFFYGPRIRARSKVASSVATAYGS